MKFGIVDPTRQRYYGIDGDWNAALAAARLTPGAIDHGTVCKPLDERHPGIAIAVSELGLFVPPGAQSYFSINRGLYGGAAVLYGFAPDGATVDVPPIMTLPFLWLRDQAAVETAIMIGTVKRPTIGVPGDTLWRWPGPRPSDTERLAFHARTIQAALARGETVLIDGDTTISVLDDGKRRA